MFLKFITLILQTLIVPKPKNVTHQQKTSTIRKEIVASYKQLKARYPILRYQNFLGFSIFFLSIAFIIITSALWLNGSVPTWAMIVLNAFFMGILHEIEHDLIHWMYFKNNKFIHNAMLLCVWILRPLTINPWIRRDLHYHHHKYSGTLHDVEERGVTNGEKWTLKRLLTTPDLLLGGAMRLKSLFIDIKREVALGNLKIEKANKLKRYVFIGLVPFTIISHVILYAFTVDLLLNFLHTQFSTGLLLPTFIKDILSWCQPYIYLILLPNLLRQFCLHFITSNMHYFGDVEDGNVIEQTQVLNVWWTFPMQLFCFFFGWTHSIHHFVVNETFYVRHIVRKKAYNIMRRHGVRFNDLGTFKRANRFNSET